MNIPRIRHDGLREVTHGEYTLVRYKKPLVDPALAVYRSVVFKGDQLVAFTPPRSTPLSDFKTTCPDPECAVVREYVDGTMIYLWWSESNGWRMSTRSCIDADKVFRRGVEPVRALGSAPVEEKSKTPRMQMEKFIDTFNKGYATASFYDCLNKNCTYVFSMLDPFAFNVVKPKWASELFLTNVYRIEGNTVTPVPLESVYETFPVNSPTMHFFRDYADIKADLDKRDYAFKGYMVTDPATGLRTKVLNPAYLKAHELYGSTPNFNKAVLKCVLEKKSEEILNLGEFDANVVAIETNTKRFANLLYSAYLECFVQKKKAHKDYDWTLRIPLYQLHKIYLETHVRVNKQTVMNYVYSADRLELMAGILGIETKHKDKSKDTAPEASV